MPHPEAITATNQHQEGYREGTWGRLLPAYRLQSDEHQISLTGASTEGSLVVSDVRADPQSFIEPILPTVDES